MTEDILDQIAREIGEVTEKQEDSDPDEEEDEDFDPEDYSRDMDDYNGGW